MKVYNDFCEIANVMLDIALILKVHNQYLSENKVTDIVYKMISMMYGENAANAINKDKMFTRVYKCDKKDLADRKYYHYVFVNSDDESNQTYMYKTFGFYNYGQLNIVIILPKINGIYTNEKEKDIINSIFYMIKTLIINISDIGINSSSFWGIEQYKEDFALYLIAGLFLFLMQDEDKAKEEFFALDLPVYGDIVICGINSAMKKKVFEKIQNFDIDPLNMRSDIDTFLTNVLDQNGLF